MSFRSTRMRIDRARSLNTVMMGNGRERKVQFQESTEILSRSPLDELEEARMWYSSSDLYAVRQDCKATLRALKKADWNAAALDQSKYCLRGLEHLQKRGGIQEKRNRTRSLIHGILSEQMNQRRMGINDPKGLQVLASACSKQARERALIAGKKDEHEAKEILQDSSCSLDYSSVAASDASSVGSDSQKLSECSFTSKIILQDRQSNVSYARSA